jgi:ABC-type branched-subunit amino acid transport system ATPase component
VLEVADLHVCYGGTVNALAGVSLQVADRSIVAVLGSNGAGKSTLLRAVSGVLSSYGGRIVAGTILLDDQPLTGLRAAEIVRRGLVHVPEGRRIFTQMSVEDNLRAGAISCRSRTERAVNLRRVFDLFPLLQDRRRLAGGLLSGGEQQMLAIGRSLMASPRFLQLDEPSLGLAPQIVEQIGGVIRQIHDQGTSVLLVEQNAAVALEVADAAYVLEVGKVALSGSASTLSNDDRVRRLYLGQAAGDIRQVYAIASTEARQRTLSRWEGP